MLNTDALVEYWAYINERNWESHYYFNNDDDGVTEYEDGTIRNYQIEALRYTVSTITKWSHYR